MKCFIYLTGLCALAAVTQGASIGERSQTVQGILGENDKNKLSAQVTEVDKLVQGIPFHEKSGAINFENKQTGLGLGLSRDSNSAGNDVITKALTGNFPLNDKNSLAAALSESQIKTRAFELRKETGTVGWEHADGHGLSASLSRFSDGLGKQAAVNGYTNLYKSGDGNTLLNANAGASKWLNGPFRDQKTDFNFGLSATHFFKG